MLELFPDWHPRGRLVSPLRVIAWASPAVVLAADEAVRAHGLAPLAEVLGVGSTTHCTLGRKGKPIAMEAHAAALWQDFPKLLKAG